MIKKIMFFSVILLSDAAYACPGVSVRIPEQIKAPAGHEPLLTVHAKGDQIYQCAVSKGEYSWAIQAPDAKLFDDQGQIVGNHSAGPLWEYKEGGRVVGKIVKKLAVNPEVAISWLLVEVVKNNHKGLLAGVKFINRVNTNGGLPPVLGCDANHLGGERRVAYTADYIFYGAN